MLSFYYLFKFYKINFEFYLQFLNLIFQNYYVVLSLNDL